MATLTKSNFLENLQKELGGEINKREKFYLIHFLITSISSSTPDDGISLRLDTCRLVEQVDDFTLSEKRELVMNLLENLELNQKEG